MNTVAPIELMSQFLLLVSSDEFNVDAALTMCYSALEFEPNNQMLLKYQNLLVTLQRDGVATYNSQSSESEEGKSTSGSEAATDGVDEDSDSSSRSSEES